MSGEFARSERVPTRDLLRLASEYPVRSAQEIAKNEAWAITKMRKSYDRHEGLLVDAANQMLKVLKDRVREIEARTDELIAIAKAVESGSYVPSTDWADADLRTESLLRRSAPLHQRAEHQIALLADVPAAVHDLEQRFSIIQPQLGS